VGLSEAPIFARGLNSSRAFNRLAEGLQRYTRRRRYMCLGRGTGGGRDRRAVCGCSLLSVLYHLPRSLILPTS
jgi:hypothetical protein